MATFPTITVNNAAVSITTNNPISLSYQQVVQTLNYTSYQIGTLYLLSIDAGLSQISQPLTLTIPSSNGQQLIYPYSPAIDSYQYQNSLFFNPDSNFVLSQLSTLSFSMLPNASLEMIFYYDDAASFNFLLPSDTNNSTDQNNLNVVDNSDEKKSSTVKKIVLIASAATIATILTKIIISGIEK